MEDVITYLSKYREETPTWLENYLHGGKITFQDIMSSRVAFYPGYFQRGNCDGTLIKVGNKSQSVHSFLYVDYEIGRKELEKQIAKPDSFRGYHPIGQIEWKEADLLPIGQGHVFYKSAHNNEEAPFCFSVVFERDEDQDDSWGAEHFVVTFLFANAITAYYRLFIKEYSKAPWLFLLNERYKGNIFGRDIQRSEEYPSFVIFQKKAKKWVGYEKVKGVHPVLGEFRCRRDLYKCMKYKFRVWIDGIYYYEDEEYEREIDLSKEEYDTIRTLVNEYDNDLSRGLMPILEAGSSELYQKFYRVIFPEVFLELFSRDDLFEPEPGDEDKSWGVEDFDYLMKTYGENYYFDEAYIVRIPDEIMPPRIHLSKGMSKEDILKYIRRWSCMRNDLYEDISVTLHHDISPAGRNVLLELIEKRLIDIAEEAIEQNDEATLANDKFNPFADIIPFTPNSITREIIDDFQKRALISG